MDRPDLEKTLGQYLRTHPDLIALDANVAPRTPGGNLSRPWVRVMLLDARALLADPGQFHIDQLVQFDCYAGDVAMAAHVGQAEAKNLCDAVVDALVELQGQAYDDTIFSRIRPGWRRLPDEDFKPARERYIVSAQVIAHQTAAVAS